MNRSGRKRIVVGSLLFSLVLVVVIAPAAMAAWIDAETVSPVGQNGVEPRVAVDSDGDAVLGWRRSDGTNLRIQARARSATGALSAVQTLSPVGQDAFGPEVAVDADAVAVVTWWRSDGTNDRIQARARSAAGALSAVQTLSDPGQDALVPQVAVDADGDAVFVWERFDGTDVRVQARARSATGALSAVQTLSPAGQGAIEQEVAVDTDGDAVFVWKRSDGTNDRIQARARSAAGTLSAVQTLSAAGQIALQPEVGVDDDGDAVFVWRRSDGTNSRIQARARTFAGALSAIQTLSAAGQNAADPQVAVHSVGNAVLIWDRFDGMNQRIESRTRSPAGALSAVQTLSPAGQDAITPQVGVAADGDAVAVWRLFDGTYNQIQASAGP